MEDVGKAIIMVAEVLMFILAITIAIYLYTEITDNTRLIMLSSNYDNKGDLISSTDSSTVRSIPRSEVIMAILSIYDNPSLRVYVDGVQYYYDYVNNYVRNSGNTIKIDDRIGTIITELIKDDTYLLYDSGTDNLWYISY